LRPSSKEEFKVELKLGGSHLCHIKIFTGRPPHYGPWAEVFNLSPDFVGPVGAPRLLRLTQIHGAEYIEDGETFNALRRGISPEETWLGRLLTRCGFCIIKDWYFPEGWLEGGMKLQAEKV